MKRLISLLLTAALACALLGGCGKTSQDQTTQCQTTALKFFDASGQQLVIADSLEALREDDRSAYWEVALEEAAQILADQTGVTAEEAQQTLLTGGYCLYTAFDQGVYTALESAYESAAEGLSTGIAITDLQGRLLAVYSGSLAASQTNYASTPTSPYSTLKPLSVYAQAVEQGIIHWTTFYEDSPYKELENEDGTLEDWPANANGQYTWEDVTVAYAIQRSLNTVAVKCLADVGVENSIAFLQDKLGMDLQIELSTAQLYGEEEVLGNVALGYLQTGASPIDMAGYYQMFANGGKYEAPEAVQKLCGPDGTVLYERTYEPEQVISATTAQIMNRFLQEVVHVGTGQDAACSGIQIAGKTGTGDSNSGNWFVGVTPGYSCAVWHGQAYGNQAELIFAAAIQNLYASQPNANRNFISYANLQELVCCSESGLAFGPNCTTIEVGYFAPDETIPVCQAHE